MKSIKSFVVIVIRYAIYLTSIVCFIWTIAIILFSFLPVPYSSVMFYKQLSAWSSGQTHYRIQQYWIASDYISPYIKLAVIAAEDQKFLQHSGVDFAAIKQALHQHAMNKPLRGASTLSQQTAKNLFLWSGRSWLRKGIELGLTLELELFWSKDRILTVYLNIAEFGPGIFGVEKAAQHYFHKSANRLTKKEAALLVAVLPNPLIYRIDKPSAYILQRQRWIMKQMDLLGGVSWLKRLERVKN